MLSDVDQNKPDLTDGAFVSARSSFVSRKIWLPRLIYDCLPYFYLTVGFVAIFTTLYINAWFWMLPHYCLFAAACIHLGAKVFAMRHRRNERARWQQRAGGRGLSSDT